MIEDRIRWPAHPARRPFDYARHVRENGFVFVPRRGYVSPQMHADMLRIREQARRDWDAIYECIRVDYDEQARRQEWTA